MRDGQMKGGTLESGTSHKAKIGGELPANKTVGKNQKPAPNPSTKARDGHTIK